MVATSSAICGGSTRRICSSRCTWCAAVAAVAGACAVWLEKLDPDEEERRYGEAVARNGGRHVSEPSKRSSWAPINLRPILDGTAPSTEPTLLQRDDGVFCLYAEKVHYAAGESESGKTMLAMLATRQELHAGRHVAFFDFESDENEVVQRVRDACVPDDVIDAQFHYIRPEEALDDFGNLAVTDLFESCRPSLAVIDGVTEGMVMHGLELKDNSDIARWLAMVPKPIARRGAAVLQIDHVSKDREGRGRFAIGGQHKLAGIDGAAFTCEVLRPFGRGLSGAVRISVAKDRPGWIRRHAPGGVLGELRIESDPDGGLGLELVAPPARDTGSPFHPTVLMERVSRLLEANPDGLSKRAVRAGVNGKHDAKDLALEVLIAEEFVRVERDGSARRHVSIRPFRNDEDCP